MEFEQLVLLGMALVIGLLIGVERGWASREAKEGERIAGLRTYGLTGLLGGGAGLLATYLDSLALGFVFLGFALAVTAAYVVRRETSEDVGITGLVSLLLTFVLGGLATLGHAGIAASAAVVAALLLRFKHQLHGWLRKLEREELNAALQLLLISVVLLPVLPDRGYGPWQALNPYEIWWMVVLIASLSFIGYFAMKIAGAEKGVVVTALAAGMASSTALTLHFARLAHKQAGLKNLLAAGILIACGTMFPRMLLIASLVNTALFTVLLLPMLVMTAVTLLSATLIWRRTSKRAPDALAPVSNPLELKPALVFGGLLMLVMLLGKAALAFFGEAGLYALAMVSGIADVDAINLTLSRMSLAELHLDVVMTGIVIAAASNSLIKGLLAVLVGGRGLAPRVLLPLGLAAATGLLTVWLR